VPLAIYAQAAGRSVAKGCAGSRRSVGAAEQSEVDCSGRYLQMTIMLRLV